MKVLTELYLAVADFLDGLDDPESSHPELNKAYHDVFRSRWGYQVYSDAVDQAVKKL